MLTANRTASRTFRKDCIFEVLDGGAPIATINDTRRTFEMGGESYSIVSSGVLGPKRELKCGDRVIATAEQKALVNTHILTYGGKEWTFKAANFSATKYALFENETQIGTVSPGSYFNRSKGITADLPDALSKEVQVFLLAIFIGKLMEPS